MRWLRNIQARLFLIGCVVYSGFFATNVVREHYPAFALIEHGSPRCDDYLGFHDDIFRYKDGHSYINNNLLTSALAALPLLLFKPALSSLERYSHAQLEREAAAGAVDVHYQTKYADRRELFRRAKLAGKDLFFGAATAITAALLMAPVSALCVALLYGYLRKRAVPERRALGLALVFAFGTPVFYRAASLNHNTLLMAAAFGSFLCLFEPPGQGYAPSLSRRVLAGLLLGTMVALDYGGLVPAAVLGLYYLTARSGVAGPVAATRGALSILCGTLPGLLFLLGSQWLQFGDPFLPAQFVMSPAQYSDEGLRGIAAPSLEIFAKNLFSPGWGMYCYGPILLLGLIPCAGRRADSELVVPRRERRMFALLIASFLLFCSMNRYSLLQYNTGFRYLAVLVPFVFLQACDSLLRLRRPLFSAASALAVTHTVVLCMARDATETERYLRDTALARGVPEYQLPGYFHALLTQTPVPLAYQRILDDGPQLPWLTVLSQTSNLAFIRGPVAPTLLVLLMLGLCAALWQLGGRAAALDPHRAGRSERQH